MLTDGRTITAVLDFGGPAIIGDCRLDPLTAAVYLTTSITPTATDTDRSVAREWLATRGLDELSEAARRWIAAFWSFAHDNPKLFAWCQATLSE